jgi:predicted RNase H-like HicB family nuclease
MRRYIALIQSNSDYGLAAKLPDFPDLFVVAKTMDKLRELVTDDLASHIEAMQRAGKTLPAPSSFDALMAEPQNRDYAALLVWARDAAQPIPRQGNQTEGLHAQSNDEWPEADA